MKDGIENLGLPHPGFEPSPPAQQAGTLPLDHSAAYYNYYNYFNRIYMESWKNIDSKMMAEVSGSLIGTIVFDFIYISRHVVANYFYNFNSICIGFIGIDDFINFVF